MAESVTGRGSATEANWTLIALIRRHRWTSVLLVTVVIVLVAVTLLTTVTSPHRQALTDAASCSQWAAATPAQQLGYSHLYIDEYGRTADTAARAAAVRASIDHACTDASYLGEADDVTVVAALKRAF